MIGIPVNFRPNIKSISDVKWNNQIVLIPLELAVCPTIDEGLSKNKAILNSMVKILMKAHSFLMSCYISTRLPFNLDQIILDYITDGLSVTYSSPVFSKTALIVNGKKSIGVFYYCPTLNYNHASISISAYGDAVAVTCFTDTASGIDDPQQFVDLFIQNNRKALESYDPTSTDKKKQ